MIENRDADACESQNGKIKSLNHNLIEMKSLDQLVGFSVFFKVIQNSLPTPFLQETHTSIATTRL